VRSVFTRRYEWLWVRNGRGASFFLGSRWTQTWSYAAPKNYVAGPIQRHRVLTRSTGCRQQASRKFISRKNEKLLDKQQEDIFLILDNNSVLDDYSFGKGILTSKLF